MKDFKILQKKQKYGVATPHGKADKGTASTNRVHQRGRCQRCTNERDFWKCLRERRIVVRTVEALVNPTEDGTELRITGHCRVSKDGVKSIEACKKFWDLNPPYIPHPNFQSEFQ